MLPISKRFRGFLPIVVDIETAGIEPQNDAVLEIAIVLLDRDQQGLWQPSLTFSEHIEPFEGANINPEALKINKIDPFHPFRFAKNEKDGLNSLFTPIRDALKQNRCERAVLVGHNAWFDLLFLKAAINRSGLKNPFHAFTSFDTATLAGIFYGQTVLVKACHAAGIDFRQDEAHSAVYDAEKTALLFCEMLNKWDTVA